MTVVAIIFASGNGIPARLLGLAMLCDTALIITAMVISHV